MISPCPPYYSSALSCLLRSHHVLLFRLVASDCLSCSAKLGRSVLSSSLALSFSMPLASCLLLSCYSARILSALLCHEAASIWYWEARLRLSHQGTQTNLCVSCVCRGAEARTCFSAEFAKVALVSVENNTKLHLCLFGHGTKTNYVKPCIPQTQHKVTQPLFIFIRNGVLVFRRSKRFPVCLVVRYCVEQEIAYL